MITCLGVNRETTWHAVREGRYGAGPLTAMEQPLAQGKDGGQAVDLPADYEPESPREVRYLRRALLDALADAGLDRACSYAPDRCGLLFGTTLHGMRAAGKFLRTGEYEPLRTFLAASVLRAAARDLPFSGLAATTCSACSSSLGSVALGVTLLRSRELDLVVAGGYDPVSEYVYGGFNSLRLVTDGPLRPFARGRSGMKLAEGYGVVVLERADDARRRGLRRPLARVLGFGESADAHHLTQPHPQGDGAARAVAAALRSAALGPQDIDLIAAHATGTPDNDAGEFAALRRVFGEALERVPVVGFKSHLGHTLGGAGAVELILAATALRDGVVPPCANERAEDVEFEGLNLSVGAARTAALRTSLNTSLGFGGANTCVILGKDGVSPPRVPNVFASPPVREVFITGVGVVLPGALGNEAFARRLLDPAPRRVAADTGPIEDEAIMHLLNARRVRRMSGYVKLSLAATTLAFADAGIGDVPAFAETCSAILGSTHGSTNYSADYYGQIVREGIAAANPMLFAEGVPNAAAAHLSLMLSLKGACQTIIGSRTAGLDALRLAAARVAAGEWERAVVGAGEEYSPLVNAAYRSCGLYDGDVAGEPFTRGGGLATGCGAVTLVLESGESMRARGGTLAPRGVLRAWASAASLREGRDEVDSVGRVIRGLGSPRHVVGSANGTWVDRAEAAALRQAARAGAPAVVSSLYGHIAETFSVGPLAAAAAVLLTGRLPALFGPGPGDRDRLVASTGEPASSFAVLCTDHVGLAGGCRIQRGGREVAA
jgi:3-oxoacyl-[acyl-carrier-protein] synthase II